MHKDDGESAGRPPVTLVKSTRGSGRNSTLAGLEEDTPSKRRDADLSESFARANITRIIALDPNNPDRIMHELRAYWEGLRKGLAVPTRADVHPAGLRRVLDNAFILERVAPGSGRFRLAGRHLSDLMGMEVRGMPLCALLNPSGRGWLSDTLETVFRGPQSADMTLYSPSGYGRPELTGRMLILPLTSDLGDVTRAIGCIAIPGQFGISPRRFDVTDTVLEPVIRGGKLLQPSPSAHHEMAEAPAPFTPAPRSAPSRISEDETPEERRARFRII